MLKNKQVPFTIAVLISLIALLSKGHEGQAQENPRRPQMTTSGAIGVPAQFSLPPQVVPQISAAAVQSVDDWTPDVTEGFESDLTAWKILDSSEDGFERSWGMDDSNANSGTKSVWVAAGGGDGVDPASFFYPNNLDSWLVYNSIIDLTQVQAADIEFAMLMDTEPQFDWVFVGVSTDGNNFTGEYWTGFSGGWQSYSIDLAEYVGQPQVYLAWYFHSDENNDKEYEGVWIDDITLWSYVDTGPAQVNDAVQNGDFETGDLGSWTVPAGSTVAVTDATNPISGTKVAYFGGIPNANEKFYQALNIPSDASSARISFYANQFGEENSVDSDRFCAGLYASNLTDLVLDLGCLDGVESFSADFAPEGWRQIDINITGAQWEQIKGKVLNLTFEMYTNESLDTTVLIDDVLFETAKGGTPSDGNDAVELATPATLGQEMSNLSIDPALDKDFYSFSATAGSTIVVDVNAAVNGSALDSYVEIQSANSTVLCANDDDDTSADSYLTCMATTAATYYAVVRAYDNSGDRSYTYSVKIQVATGAVPTPTPPPAPTDTPPPPSGNAKRAWTAIIYIDGDNNLCNSYPVLISRMEQELGERIGANGFLNIAVLFDRDPRYCNGAGGTQRLLIQPNGSYQDNVNRWDMGEVHMGAPRTLANFAKWAMQNYPADHYYLAIDNHGGGIDGVAWDDTNGHDQLTPDEVHAALKEITSNGQTKIDIFAYEACLMGMYENAYDIHEFTKNIFFFSTVAWTNTASYPSYLGDSRFTAATDGRGLGQVMFDVTFNAVQNPMILSLIDSSKMPAVHSAVSAFGDQLQTYFPDSKPAEARNAAQKIDSDANDRLSDSDFYLDLWSLADQVAARDMATSQAAALKSAVEAAVIQYNYRPANAQLQVNYAGAHGLSIYWPNRDSGSYSKYVSGQLYTATREGRWDDFLTVYMGGGAKRPGMESSYGAIDKRLAASPASNQIFLPLVSR